MYACAGCGGDLKFDIASQQLKCVYCNETYDPYSVDQTTQAEQDDYDVTLFKCPQCGGEIYSTDNTAAGFCSFCGASTVLTSRLVKSKKVNYIIPFKQSKEDCKNAYKKLMRHALFVPKELKDEKHIDSFRGIYMPYWVYYVKQQGHVKLHGEKSHRSGDYIVTRHYGLHMDLDAQYKGLSYDASTSFADNISQKLAPYDVKNMKAFTPSYLSGFYADASDVDAQIYAEDAVEFAQDETMKYMKNLPSARGYSLTNVESQARSLPTGIEQTDSAMFPVWFLSYQNKGRVAYATVNGQTGKVVADLPVDIKKYIFGSILLAIPIIILLNMFLTLRPSVVLSIVALLGAGVIGVHASEMKQIAVEEGMEDDKGAQIGFERKRRKEQEQRDREAGELGAAPYVVTEEQMRKDVKKPKNKKSNITLSSIIVIMVFVMFFSQFASVLFSEMGGLLVSILALVIAGVCSAISMGHAKKIKEVKTAGTMGALIAVIIAAVILIMNPVSDTWYYGAVVISLLAIGFTLVDLIQSFNVLATRKLPQLDYKGGDDLA